MALTNDALVEEIFGFGDTKGLYTIREVPKETTVLKRSSELKAIAIQTGDGAEEPVPQLEPKFKEAEVQTEESVFPVEDNTDGVVDPNIDEEPTEDAEEVTEEPDEEDPEEPVEDQVEEMIEDTTGVVDPLVDPVVSPGGLTREDYVSKLESLVVDYEEVIQKGENDIQQIQNEKDAILESFRKMRDHFVDSLDEVESSLLQSLEEKIDVVTMSGEVDTTKTDLEELQSHIAEISVDESGPDDPPEEIAALESNPETMDENLAEYESKLESHKQALEPITLSFDVDTDLAFFVTEGDALIKKAKRVLLMEDFGDKQEEVHGEKYAKEVGSFEAKLETEQGCHLVSAEYFPDGRILLADFQNNNLKLFDNDFHFVSELKFDTGPWDIGIVNEKEAVVTLPFESRVQFVSTTNDRLKLGRSIAAGSWACHSILCKDNVLVMLVNQYSSILMYKFNGELVNQIGEDKKGNKLFSDIRYIAFNNKKDVLYISDDDKGVMCVDMSGRIKWTGSDNNLDVKHPRGIAVDAEGHIYVCGTSTGCVHQLSEKGEQIKIFIGKENIQHPWAITYSVSKNTLLVTGKSSNVVKVYAIV